MGSTILRSECMTTLSVVSARAGGASSARHHSREAVRHAAATRRMDVMDSSSREFQVNGLTPEGGAALSIHLPMGKRKSHGAPPCQRGRCYHPAHVRADRAPRGARDVHPHPPGALTRSSECT